MSGTSINQEECIGKTVGSRVPNRDAWKIHEGLVAYVNETVGGIFYPRGVFRFHSFQEADQWMMHYQQETARQRSHAPQPAATSPGSPAS
jgi:hypothetical protein